MGKTLELVRKISKTEGFEEGKIVGETNGEARFAALLTKLISLGRQEDVNRVLSDATYRKELMKELAIQ